jgi:hypothetical protein
MLIDIVLGRTWFNNAGTKIGTSGSSLVNVNTAGLIVDALNADHGLMNQESQTVDSTGQPHICISYVPGALLLCLFFMSIQLIIFLRSRPLHPMRNKLRN